MNFKAWWKGFIKQHPGLWGYIEEDFEEVGRRAWQASQEQTKKKIERIFKKEVNLVKAICHNYLKQPLYEEKLQKVVISHMNNFRGVIQEALSKDKVKEKNND